MKKTVKLTESDLLRIIKRLVRENEGSPSNTKVLKSTSLNEQDEKMENCDDFNKQMDYLSKLAIRAIAFLPNKLQNVVKKSFDSAIQSGDESKILRTLPSNIKSEVEKKKGQLSSEIKNTRDLENKLDDIASTEVNEQLQFVTPAIKIIQTIVFLLVILKFAGLLKKRNSSCSYTFF
jgi:hypothetical protein